MQEGICRSKKREWALSTDNLYSYQIGCLLMNIDARVAELKHSDIPEKDITLLLNLRYV